jgi:CRISPR-associated protein Csd2
MQGLMTDGCIKRKVRDYIDLVHGDQGRYKIYVQNKGVALNTLHQRAYTAAGVASTGSKQKREEVDQAQAWMCANFYDIRAFGAVMNTEVNCGQVRGPLQITLARSIDPIVPIDLSITRVAITDPKDIEVTAKASGGMTGKVTEMGRKAIVPYGLYRGYGFYSPHFATRTGFDSQDLELFWQALMGTWDLDRSAARGMMSFRGLWVYTHQHPLGNAPAHQLVERVQVQRKAEVEAPRSFSDYLVEASGAQLPEGITQTSL